MALSTITTISSSPFKSVLGWGPISFVFPTSLTSYTISSNSFTYSGGSGSTLYKNGTYVINANTWNGTYPPYKMFDGDVNSLYMCGVNAGTNYKLDGTTATYNRNAYTINSTPAPYVGGSSGTVWNTNGYNGEYFQIQYPFNFILTKVYLMGEAGGTYSRSPKTMYIFGSTDGTNWTYVDVVTSTMNAGSPTEFSYNVTNSTKYTYYRFVANTLIGGHSWDGALSMTSFRTEGNAYSL